MAPFEGRQSEDRGDGMVRNKFTSGCKKAARTVNGI